MTGYLHVRPCLGVLSTSHLWLSQRPACAAGLSLHNGDLRFWGPLLSKEQTRAGCPFCQLQLLFLGKAKILYKVTRCA